MPWVENFQHLFKESASTEQTLISGGLNLKGDMLFNGPGSVAGTIEGSLESAYHVSIDDDARITGPCSAGNLHVSGKVAGDLNSSDHVRLGPGSHVRGDISGATLEITTTADFEGALNIGATGSE